MRRIIITVLYALIAALLLTAKDNDRESVPADSISKELQEIVVTARQPATKVVGNTLVSTIAGSELEGLGTCLDVLGRLPLLTVRDTEVTVTGKGSPEIYIDGRPMRDAEELRQLQSGNIRKVELLMAPGAMYSAETGAVLKITTRRSFLDGLSLTERAEVTARRKWQANELLDVSYRAGSWDFFATATVARNNSLVKGTTTNSLVYEGKPVTVGSTQHNLYPSVNGTVKAGVNYSEGRRSAGGYYRFNPERGDFSNHGTEWFDSELPVGRDISRSIRGHNHMVSAYYDDTFGDGYNLHFDGVYRGAVTRNGNTTVYPGAESDDVASRDKRSSTLWAGKLYLEFPLLKGSMTAGVQGSHTRTNLDFTMLSASVGQYIPSSLTETRQSSAALFAAWSRMFGKFSLTAGLRYDYVDYLLRIDGEKQTDSSRRDNLLSPDIALGYNFSDDGNVGLSYRLATVRPPYSQLTGSLSYVGRHEIEGGNPALHDEKMHDIGLTAGWRGFMMQADFTRSIDTYAFVKSVYPAHGLQLVMRPVNIDVSSLDIYLIWSKKIKAWRPEVTVGMHRQWLEIGGQAYNKPLFTYYFDNVISLPRGFMLTVSAFGRSEGDMHTNRFGATAFSMDASLGKSFFSNALQIKLSATDIFNSFNSDWRMTTNGITVDKRQSYDYRGVSLSVTYRLHPAPSKYKGGSASEAEMRRL